MDLSSKAVLQPVEGEQVPDSLMKLAGGVLASVVAGLIGAGLLWAWWTDASFANRKISTLGGLFGVGMALLGVLGPPVLIFKMLRGAALILGHDCLQRVVSGNRVTMQIPYKNIARIEFVRQSEHTGVSYDFIGIELHDASDSATLCKNGSKSKNARGWHLEIDSGAMIMPLEKLYDQICWRLS